VKEEVLSNRSLNIAIWDVFGIIRCPRNGIFFPWDVLPLNDPYSPIFTLASLPACTLMSSLFGVTLALPHR
jgi:hypothetical protein